MRKIFPIILAAAILSLSLFSCSSKGNSDNNDDSNKTTSAAEENTKESQVDATIAAPSYELPVKDFSDFELKAYVWNDCRWANTIFDVSEQNAEIVDTAIYNRNRSLEDDYGVKISEVGYADPAQVVRNVDKDVAAGLDSFQIAFVDGQSLASLISKGCLYNLKDFPYIDVTKPWWDKGSVEDLSIGGKYYGLTGDIQYMSFDATWILTFNKKLIQENGLENPYDIVQKNQWTLDKFSEMLKATVKDIDGNGIYDEHDSYGFATHSSTYSGLYIGAGQRFYDKDSTDYPKLIPVNSKAEDVYTKILDIMHSQNRTFDPTGKFSDALVLVDVFVDDRALFMGEVMGALAHQLLRSMPSDYGIVPWPKYDESQDGYYNYVHPQGSLMVVPSTCPDTERLGLLIESLAYKSYIGVRPVFYDTVLRLKSARDEQSFDMLNLIFKRRIYELGLIYNWGSLMTDFDTNGLKNNNVLASMYEKKTETINKQIEKFVGAFN